MLIPEEEVQNPRKSTEGVKKTHLLGVVKLFKIEDLEDLAEMDIMHARRWNDCR